MLKKYTQLIFATLWLLALSGCASYRLDRVDQLYLGQAYLPLPAGYVPDKEIIDLVGRAPSAIKDADCTLPQARWRDANGGGRPNALLLPGMTLKEVETTYERLRAFTLPVVSESQWTVPKIGHCGDDVFWSRESLLRVRHLLSRAVGESTVVNTPPDTDYYLQALRWAGCTANGSCSFTEVRKRFLEPFVANFHVNYRDTGLTWQQTALSIPNTVVVTKLADHGSLARWFQAVNGVRDADFFNFPTPYTDSDSKMLDIGTLCARLQARRPASPQFVGETAQTVTANAITDRSDVERACNFNLKRLSIPSGTWQFGTIASDWAKKLTGGELTLLQTGDALLMFRPAAHAEVLDSAARNVCTAANGQTSLDCLEHQRLSQGFIDFELLLDVSIVPRWQQIRVPITMTIAQFEAIHGNGAKVRRIRRSLVWVPSKLAAVSLPDDEVRGTQVDTLSFAEDGFVELRFMAPGSEEGRRSSALYIHDTLKDQVLLAPGDVLTMSR